MDFLNRIPAIETSSSNTARKGPVLQRACACGQHTHGEGECESCRKRQPAGSRMQKQLEVQSAFPALPANRGNSDRGQGTHAPLLIPNFGRPGVDNNPAVTGQSNPSVDFRERAKREGGQPSEDEDRPPQLLEKEIPKDENSGVRTVLRKGAVPQTLTGVPKPRNQPDPVKHAIVAPGGAPAVNNAAAGNDCLPSTASAVLNWGPVSADANNWGVSVNSLTLAGQINLKPWPSSPNSMVVPNTPNPVDGGNINNTAGSSNHWQAAIDDMADYNSPGGGAGPNWHSDAASSAHEWAHWNTDYVADSVSSAAGGNWPQANADLEALRAPKAANPTPVAARAALLPRVNARMGTWRSQTISRWNAIPDSPGVAGSTGYAAGMAVLNTLISAVRAYATTKGWTGGAGGAPAGGGSTGLSTGAKAAIGAGAGVLVGAGIGALVGGPIGAAIGAGIGGLAGGLIGAFS